MDHQTTRLTTVAHGMQDMLTKRTTVGLAWTVIDVKCGVPDGCSCYKVRMTTCKQPSAMRVECHTDREASHGGE